MDQSKSVGTPMEIHFKLGSASEEDLKKQNAEMKKITRVQLEV